MSLVRPSFAESVFNSFFVLESDRWYYYKAVVERGIDVFEYMDDEEAIKKLHQLIGVIEAKYKMTYFAFCETFYNRRHAQSYRAYFKMGDTIDYQKVTRYDMLMELEVVKEFIRKRVIQLSHKVRFTTQQPIMG